MSALFIWRAGLRRVARAPWLVALLWCLTLVITIPPALALNDAVSTHLGSSLEADTAASGMNYDWMQEFRAQADSIGRSLRPDVIGFAAVVDNASAFADMSQRPAFIVVASVFFVGFLWLLTPGILCRLAVNRRIGPGAFAGTCGAFAGRILRLNIVSMFFYGTLVGTVHQWLFDDVFDAVTHDLTVERTAFLFRVVFYVLFFALLALCNLVFDMAKVRLVVEDRRSVLATIVSALDFTVSNSRLVIGAYGANLLTLALVVGTYAAIAPGVGGAGAAMWITFIVGQVYIAARLCVKLAFWASGVAALQSRLAYDGFVRTLPDPAPAVSGPQSLVDPLG
ncbi:MAG: hypothetical protein U0Q11_21290 [Vicinamibacterales bacterium]